MCRWRSARSPTATPPTPARTALQKCWHPPCHSDRQDPSGWDRGVCRRRRPGSSKEGGAAALWEQGPQTLKATLDTKRPRYLSFPAGSPHTLLCSGPYKPAEHAGMAPQVEASGGRVGSFLNQGVSLEQGRRSALCWTHKFKDDCTFWPPKTGFPCSQFPSCLRRNDQEPTSALDGRA